MSEIPIKSDKKQSEKTIKSRHYPKKNYKKVAGHAVTSKSKDQEVKKSYKVVIRNLPYNDFNEEKFRKCLEKFINSLNISPECVQFLHFMEGKLSRKRGPLSGAGFFCVHDESAFLAISQCASVSSPESDTSTSHPTCLYVPFLPEESTDAQPQVCIASYQKRFREKGRVDKLVNSLTNDSDFLKFQKDLHLPAEKLPSAEAQLEAKERVLAQKQDAKESFIKKETAKLKALASKRERSRGGSVSSKTERAIRLAVAANLANKESAEAIKKNPLLQFIKEKAERKSIDRKIVLKEQSKKKHSASSAKGSTKEKDRDDINKQGKARLSNDKDKDKGGKFKEKPERLKKDGNNGTGDGDIATKPVTVILKKRGTSNPSADKTRPVVDSDATPSTTKEVHRKSVKKDLPSSATRGKSNREVNEEVGGTAREEGKAKSRDKKKAKKTSQDTTNIDVSTTSIISQANKKNESVADKDASVAFVKDETRSGSSKKSVKKIETKSTSRSKNRGKPNKQDSPDSNLQQADQVRSTAEVRSIGRTSSTAQSGRSTGGLRESHRDDFEHPSRPHSGYNSNIMAGVSYDNGGHHNYAPQSSFSHSSQNVQYQEQMYEQHPYVQQEYYHHGQRSGQYDQGGIVYQTDYSHPQNVHMNSSLMPPPPQFTPPNPAFTSCSYSTQPNPRAAPFQPQSSNRR